MPVKAPEQARIGLEELRVSTLSKIELATIGRVVVPKALVAAKVREP